MFNSNKTPCKDCEKRYIGCHDKCELYKEFRKKYDEMKKNIIEGRKKYCCTYDFSKINNTISNSQRKGRW